MYQQAEDGNIFILSQLVFNYFKIIFQMYEYLYILIIKLYLPVYIHKAKPSIVHSIMGYIKLLESIFFSRKKKCTFFNTLK